MQAASAARNWAAAVVSGWSRFWFQPADPATLGLVRICTGAMLFYTHLVWGLDLAAFVGPRGWLPGEAVGALEGGPFAWSYLWWIEGTPPLLWTAHAAALVVFAMLALGLFTRATSILALAAALAYVHRLPGALFGLDQINVMLALYLAVGPSGDAYSLDRLWRARRRGGPLPPRHSWSANLAIRLIQVHMCVIYLFAGMAKLTGPAWWDGTALWMALGNMEYQSLDMTWMAYHPLLINLLTHVTVFWELSYAALVWPRHTRPVVLLLAIPLHMGIAICLGMVTFGLIMLVGNLAFVPPAVVRACWPARLRFGQSRGGQGGAPPPNAATAGAKRARGDARSSGPKR